MMGGPLAVTTRYLDRVLICNACNRRHMLTMDMAHSFRVCSYVRCNMILGLHLLEFPAIYHSSQSFIFPRSVSKQSSAEIYGYRRLCSDHRQRQGIRKEYVQFTDQEGWTSTVQSGMTIVMSLVMTQEAKETTATKYQCPFCDCLNSLKVNNGKASIDW